METLACIGIFAIIFVILYLYLNGIDNKEHDRLFYWKLSNYDDECIRLKKIISSAELDDVIKRIFRDPVRRNAAINKMKEMELLYIQEDERFKLEQAENRRFGYKHEDMIFEIFDNYRMLAKDDIVWSMQQYFSIQKHETVNLFNSWIDKRLIGECSNKEGFFEIGLILNSHITS